MARFRNGDVLGTGGRVLGVSRRPATAAGAPPETGKRFRISQGDGETGRRLQVSKSPWETPRSFLGDAQEFPGRLGDVFHEGLCGFGGLNLGLAAGAPPLDPALYRDRERAQGAAPGPCEGRCPSTPLGALPPDPRKGRCPLTPLGALPPNPCKGHCPQTPVRGIASTLHRWLGVETTETTRRNLAGYIQKSQEELDQVMVAKRTGVATLAENLTEKDKVLAEKDQPLAEKDTQMANALRLSVERESAEAVQMVDLAHPGSPSHPPSS